MRINIKHGLFFVLLLSAVALSFLFESTVLGDISKPEKAPLLRVVDLNVGEAQTIELCDGSKARVKLLELDEERDRVCNAVRRAEVTVEVNGKRVLLVSSTYHMPVKVAGVQVDCAVTKGYVQNSSKKNPWGLVKDARIRVWPGDSPLIEPGTFIYPVKQRWFASDTQMGNAPVFVDGGEKPGNRNIYYHYGLDFGGCEAMVEVVSATNGLVISAGKKTLKSYDNNLVKPRYDVIYVLDGRGWVYRYSHLYKIDGSVTPGARVKMGQKIGVLGKEGGSGGWSHLHFDIQSKQPSGMWGTQNAYVFAWEVYGQQYNSKLVAVARPHQLTWTHEVVELDGVAVGAKGGQSRNMIGFFVMAGPDQE